jgi:hypothetical protein
MLIQQMEATMKKVTMALLAGYVGLFASHADASSLTLTRKTVDNGWEKARMNCDQFGRCWKEGSRNALLDSYNYAPPPRGRKARLEAGGRTDPSVW